MWKEHAPSISILALLFASGCSEQHERVEYDRPAIGPIQKLVFTNTSFGATDTEVDRFSTPIHPDQQLAFTGFVAAKLPERPICRLRMTREHEGKIALYRSAVGKLEGAEDESGFRFYSEVNAPKSPGKYLVEVKVRDAVLAVGEITVQPQPHQ